MGERYAARKGKVLTMLAYLICLLWRHKTVHKAATGEFDTTNQLTGLPQKGHYYKFTRTPFCTRCGKLCGDQSAPGDWVFSSEDEITAFLYYFVRVQQKEGEDIGIALRDTRNTLKVVTSNHTARRLAQAFQFGWMAAQTQKGVKA